ncbi:glutamine synthetase family protein [Streptomyces arenae]|uniref:glutamine synthetase family protein n=1 Tax=Streptomyces arenae TaxID=29301 RepID=UPI00265A4E92|nr:glutamine synthetase family protein [Streptomyces arenae]MCG7202352.1 glutamine synthetase family protein [Streptomyces arenae]
MNSQHFTRTVEMAGFITPETLAKGATTGDIRTVMAAVPDLQGRLQGKRLAAFPLVRRIEQNPQSRAPLMEACAYILATNIEMDPMPTALTSWADGYSDMQFVPDWDTLRIIPYSPDTALVICDAVHHDGTPLSVAPRQMLRTQLAKLTEAGYEARIGLESEFMLYDADGQPVVPHNMDYALDHPPELVDFLRHLEDMLTDSDIPLEAIKTEGAAGQIEATCRYGEAMQACDNYTIYKQIVKHLARRRGLTASFMAAPATGVGSGLHLHLSLWRDGKPAFSASAQQDMPTETMRHSLGAVTAGLPSDVLQHSVGGLIEVMPQLGPLYAPYPNSYHRYATAYAFAPQRMSWGFDNRGCAIRVVGHGEGIHLEVRLGGADTNPYLYVAATLAAIIRGITEKRTPTEPCIGDAYSDRKSLPLRKDLAAATDAFETSTLAHVLLGTDVVQHYTTVATADIDRHRGEVTDVERRRFTTA